jgi:hypothetical protein
MRLTGRCVTPVDCWSADGGGELAGVPSDSVILQPSAGAAILGAWSDDGLRWEAGQHIRWGLNDLARRLDEQPAAAELREGLVPAPASTGSGLSPDGLSMLRAIGALPDEEREVFDLVRVQGMTQAEAAGLGRTTAWCRLQARRPSCWRVGARSASCS